MGARGRSLEVVPGPGPAVGPAGPCRDLGVRAGGRGRAAGPQPQWPRRAGGEAWHC